MKCHYSDVNNYYVTGLCNDLAHRLILDHHYSHRRPANAQLCFGVFTVKGELIGAIEYGEPIKIDLQKFLFAEPWLKRGQVKELLRLWIADGHGKNIESWAIAQTYPILRKVWPEVKILVAYADPRYGHLGIIYQAANWWYQAHHGTTNKAFSISLVNCPRGPEDFIHSRTLSRKYGTSNPKKLARMFRCPIYVWADSLKYRYLYFLCGRLERNRLLKALLIEPTREYPKVLRPCERIGVSA